MAVETAAEPRVGLQHQPLDVVVRDEIRRQIIAGELAPGERLVETSIADQLGVSRGPVRSAMRQLELEGFVTISPRRGASVATVTMTEALDCYEVRAVVEELSARLAAIRHTDEDLQRMQDVLAQGQRALDDERWDQLSALNNDFHVALAMASGNHELVWLMRQYSKRIAWMFSRSAQRRGAQAWIEHAGIVEAVTDGDPDLASSRAKAHIAASRDQFVLATPIAADTTLPSQVPPAAPKAG